MKQRPTEPFWWTLFGAGGVVSALFLPILVLLFGLLIPLGVVRGPTHQHLHALLSPWFARLVLLVILVLCLFHFAHRFRFTLYDGLQLKSHNRLIATLCYGSAGIVSLYSAYTLWTF